MEMETGIKKIRRSYIVLAISSLLFLLISSHIGLNLIRSKYVNDSTLQLQQDYWVEFNHLIKQQANTYSGLINLILDDPDFYHKWEMGNRDSLYQTSLSYNEIFKTKFNITHFYFIDTTGHCFLRVHKPESHGDYIDRFTFTTTKETGKLSFGIELGKFGTMTLRVVSPWYVEDKLVGYIELGEEIENMLPDISNMLNSEVYVLINKDRLNKTDWEQGQTISTHASTFDWEYHPNYVITYHSSSKIPVELSTLISDVVHSRVYHTGGGERYSGTAIDLTDAAQESIGKVIILNNQTSLFDTVKNIKLMVTILFFIIGGSLLYASLVFLKRIHHRIAGDMVNLQNEIGERKKAEKQLIIHQEELEDTVRERTRQLEEWKDQLEEQVQLRTKELRRKNKELEVLYKEDRYSKLEIEKAYNDFKTAQMQLVHSEKLASLGMLSAAIGHEINNPLAGLYGGLQILRKDFDALKPLMESLSNEQTLEPSHLDTINQHLSKTNLKMITSDFEILLKRLHEGVEHTIDVVRSLKDFSRKDSNEHVKSDIHQGLESTLVLLKYKLNTSNIKVRLNFQNGIKPINCQRGPLNMVFMNILTNAMDSINEKSSGESDFQGEITIQTYTDNSNLNIAIADNGIGMTREVIDHIFQTFYTTKKQGKGTGLGMSISMDIIKKHQGDIMVESTPGEGSKFTIVLPMTETPDESQ